MTEEPPPDVYAGKSPADLIARGRVKYALARARLHQHQCELALLSTLGSIEDVLRAHLLLYNHSAGTADWNTLLTTLRSRSEPGLSAEEAGHLNRMQRLRRAIIQGEPVTITDETILAYQQFAAALMVRYGVVVVSPENPGQSIAPEQRMVTRNPRMHSRLPRSLARLLPALLIILIFVIGAGATLALQQGRAIPESMFRPVLTATPVRDNQAANLAHTDGRPDGLSPGQIVYVRTDMAEGLPLREQPGIAAGVPIRLYLSVGTAVELLDGPVITDGTAWWKVSAANQEGWCAEEFLERR